LVSKKVKSKEKIYIIGAGFTGLAAGLSSGFKIFEAENHPGGICYSYTKDGFVFENGGGHWIFGGDYEISKLIEGYGGGVNKYNRKAGIFFMGNLNSTKELKHKFIPYPIQNNLSYLGEDSKIRSLKEIFLEKKEEVKTMDGWLKANFGQTLYETFFRPFHERYTAGMYTKIAPQDYYKSPINISEVIDGAFGICNKEVGYNTTFLYPKNFLNGFSKKLAENCQIDYNKKVVEIDPNKKIVNFLNGEKIEYNVLISTMPLNKLLYSVGSPINHLPYTSVLVLNLGVELGNAEIAKHGYHWLYIPDSKTGFHRIGYYSNVDKMFLPENLRNDDYGSLYIEFAFKERDKPNKEKIKKLEDETIKELKEIGLIKKILVSDPTWIEVAYTWNTPNSTNIQKILEELKERDIYSIGRFGGWNFQGISKSIKEGLSIGNFFNK